MQIRRLVLFLWPAAFVVGSMGGCKCGKSDKGTSSGGLGHQPITEADSDNGPLKFDFPQQWRASDQEVNAFVESVLSIAAQGDYEGFRQLFSMTHTPPSRQEFQRVWDAIERIRVAGLYGDGPEPKKYYLHAVVDRRGADGKRQLKLDRVVTVFKEANQWRLGPAPSEVVDLVIRAASQPAT